MGLSDDRAREQASELSSAIQQGRSCILDTISSEGTEAVDAIIASLRLDWKQAGERISSALMKVTKQVLARGFQGTLMCIGGDTMNAMVDMLQAESLIPIRELQPGVVLSLCRTAAGERPVISKSGGFGGRDLLPVLTSRLTANREGVLI